MIQVWKGMGLISAKEKSGSFVSGTAYLEFVTTPDLSRRGLSITYFKKKITTHHLSSNFCKSCRLRK